MLSIKQKQELDRKTYMRVDWDWVDEQINATNPTARSKQIIIKLIEVLENSDFQNNETNAAQRYVEQALKLFLGHPVYVPSDSENWSQAVPGELNVKDTVRVRTTAYSGNHGVAHNGKRGRVVSMRNGVINVVYDGNNPESASGHDVTALEKLV